jgi:hypothetical protein
VDAFELLLGFANAKHLDAKLIVLADAALLWTLVAKIRANIEELDSRAFVVHQAVLDDGAHDAGGLLWTQGEPVAVVLARRDIERFLLDDVRALADPAVKEVGIFDERRSNLGKVKDARGVPGDLLERVPLRRFGRQDVVEAFRRANCLGISI